MQMWYSVFWNPVGYRGYYSHRSLNSEKIYENLSTTKKYIDGNHYWYTAPLWW